MNTVEITDQMPGEYGYRGAFVRNDVVAFVVHCDRVSGVIDNDVPLPVRVYSPTLKAWHPDFVPWNRNKGHAV